MRDDLLDAQAAVDWAVAQIPRLQSAFLEWQRGYPYRIVQEKDPEGGNDFAVAYQITPLPRELSPWVGAIINSIRSGLDLLAVALAIRNGKKPSSKTHFPFFASEQAMLDPWHGLESKKWLSNSERATIKTLRPYKGGDAILRTVHDLDIARKHERLIAVNADVSGVLMLGNWSGWRVGGTKALQRLDNKTVLGRLRPGENLNVSQGNTLLAVFIVFSEATFGLANEEVASTLKKFADRITEVIALFDV
jgi:hypothetical protein